MSARTADWRRNRLRAAVAGCTSGLPLPESLIQLRYDAFDVKTDLGMRTRAQADYSVRALDDDVLMPHAFAALRRRRFDDGLDSKRLSEEVRRHFGCHWICPP